MFLLPLFELCRYGFIVIKKSIFLQLYSSSESCLSINRLPWALGHGWTDMIISCANELTGLWPVATSNWSWPFVTGYLLVINRPQPVVTRLQSRSAAFGSRLDFNWVTTYNKLSLQPSCDWVTTICSWVGVFWSVSICYMVKTGDWWLVIWCRDSPHLFRYGTN